MQTRTQRRFFSEVTYYDEPNEREYFDTAEEAADAYGEAIEQFFTLGHHFGDVAQIRRGYETAQGRTITHRHTAD